MREPIDSSSRGELQKCQKLMRYWVSENAAWSLRGRFYLLLGQRSVWSLLSSIEMLAHNFVSKTCLTAHHPPLITHFLSFLSLALLAITHNSPLFSLLLSQISSSFHISNYTPPPKTPTVSFFTSFYYPSSSKELWVEYQISTYMKGHFSLTPLGKNQHEQCPYRKNQILKRLPKSKDSRKILRLLYKAVAETAGRPTKLNTNVFFTSSLSAWTRRGHVSPEWLAQSEKSPRFVPKNKPFELIFFTSTNLTNE